MALNDSRERILDAAFELFFAGTFHNVGVTEICKVAGVNKGTLYHFFVSKTDVLLGVLERYTEKMAAGYEEIAQGGGEPAARLVAFFKLAQWNSSQYNLENGFCPGCFIGNISTELSAADPLVRAKAQWAMERLIRIFEPTIAELIAQTGMEGDSHKAATAFMGLLQGTQVMAKLHNNAAVFDIFAPAVVDVVLASLQPDRQTGSTTAHRAPWSDRPHPQIR